MVINLIKACFNALQHLTSPQSQAPACTQDIVVRKTY